MNWSWKRFFIILPIVFLLTWGLLSLTGCGAGPRGTVTEKEVETSFKNKKIHTCYELEITDDSGVERDICVTKSVYDSYRLGDKYPR